VTAVKAVLPWKAKAGWDALIVEAEYSAERTVLATKLRQALKTDAPAAQQKARLLLRQDAATKAWHPAALDTAAIDKDYANSNVVRALVAE
jgi:hypothetical protein